MVKITYFHRNLKSGYSINKVTQTIIKDIDDKEEYYVPYCGASFLTILRNIIFVFYHRNVKGINHITGDIHYCILGLLGCKSVLTIHDTVSLDFNRLPTFKKKIIEWLWFRIPLMFATKVVCISEATKKSVLQYTNRKDILVVYDAIDPSFKTLPKIFNCTKPRVLIIGTNPNKNLERTIKGLNGIDCKLVIIGKIDKNIHQLLTNYNIDFENKFNLSDNEILIEYEKCDIVSFISLFEGFGMLIIEANKVGRPVICSNIPVLREVADGSALFVDPYNIDKIHDAFNLLINDSTLQNKLVKQGLENVKRFNDALVRHKWCDVYNNLLN